MPNSIPKLCIPPFYGVAYAHEPPHWWETTGGGILSAFNTQLNDPRWNGAATQALPADDSGVGSHEYAVFRALHGSSPEVGLYLSWIIKTDYIPNAEVNYVHIGLCPTTSSGQGAMIRLKLKTSSSATQIATKDMTISVWKATSTSISTSAQPNPPAWLSPSNSNCRARMWVKAPMGSAKAAEWAIALYVPLVGQADIEKGLTLGTDFKMWYQVNGIEETPNDPSDPASYYAWPAGIERANLPPFPPIAGWGDVHLASTPYESCPDMNGISISSDDVCTKNPNPTEILYKVDAQGNPVPFENVFLARPHNKSGADVPADTIMATFRVRNFGSQSPTPNGWGEVAQGTKHAKIPEGQKGLIEAPWTPPASFVQAIIDGITTSEQCTLAELTGPVTFINNSAYNNLYFVEAKPAPQPAPAPRNFRTRRFPSIRLGTQVVGFTREAEISLLGLEPLPGVPYRDVHIYVTQANMPESVRSSQTNARQSAIARSIMDLLLELRGTNISSIPWEKLPTELAAFPTATVKRLMAGQQLSPGQWNLLSKHLEDIPFEQLRAPVLPREPRLRQSLSLGRLINYVPTLQVHSSYDSGKTILIDGRSRRIFLPLTSFTFLVRHPGEALAWNYQLVGAGIEPLSPSSYHLRIHNGGARRLAINVEAMVKPDAIR